MKRLLLVSLVGLTVIGSVIIIALISSGDKTAVKETAERVVITLGNYDYRDEATYSENVSDLSTPYFISEIFNSASYKKGRELNRRFKIVEKTEVISSRVLTSSASKSEIEVQSQISSQTPDGPQKTRKVTRVQLIKSGGKWLVNMIEERLQSG